MERLVHSCVNCGSCAIRYWVRRRS